MLPPSAKLRAALSQQCQTRKRQTTRTLEKQIGTELTSHRAWQLCAVALDSPGPTPTRNRTLRTLEATYEQKNCATMDLLYQSLEKQPPHVPVKVSDIFGMDHSTGLQCVKCKKRDVEYILVQTRSADEGMTAKCTCRLCSHTFQIKV
jgi:DNA-directed RNA polymerase subunit M/transcription elongation factor TFIIS